MSFKQVVLVALVGVCFLLVLATMAQAFQEASDAGAADLDQYRAVSGIKPTATSFPTSTPETSESGPSELATTEAPSGMYESD